MYITLSKPSQPDWFNEGNLDSIKPQFKSSFILRKKQFK